MKSGVAQISVDKHRQDLGVHFQQPSANQYFSHFTTHVHKNQADQDSSHQRLGLRPGALVLPALTCVNSSDVATSSAYCVVLDAVTPSLPSRLFGFLLSCCFLAVDALCFLHSWRAEGNQNRAICQGIHPCDRAHNVNSRSAQLQLPLLLLLLMLLFVLAFSPDRQELL